MTNLHKLSIGLLAGCCFFASHVAFAQTAPAKPAQTGANADMAPAQSQGAATDIGTIQIQGAGQTLGGGFIIPEDGPKDRSTVTSEGVYDLIPTASPFDMIGILPGVNVQDDDAMGLGGGQIRVRGLAYNQLGFTINGAPFNNSGNFNVYPNEIIDAEDVKQIWITHGSTDIDAPHVGASGGNVGVVLRNPSDSFNLRLGQTVGELNLIRDYVGVDTGWIGNVKALVSVSYTHADKWRGDGSYNRRHSDGNVVWQVTPQSTIGLTWVWNDSINPYYRDYASWGSYSNGIYNIYMNNKTAYQTYQTIGRSADYDTFWGSSAAYPINRSGKFSTGPCATNPNPGCTVVNPTYPQLGAGGGAGNTNVSNDQALNLNPYRNAVITVPVHVQLTDNLRWETNAYFWWGQGGALFGSTALDDNTINASSGGYKPLPQYGDAANSTNALLLAQGTVNKTQRPGVTSKLVWDIDNYSLMAGGWLEQAHMDYGTPFTTVNANGTPCDRWLTNLNGNSCAVMGTSEFGTTPVYGYHYKSNSIGEALFFDGQGRYLNDALKVNVGVAYRGIIRDVRNLNPYCADDPTLVLNPGSTTVTCASYANSSTFLTSNAYKYFNGPTVGAAAAYQAMRVFAQHPHINYHAFLPELTASYDIDDSQQVYASMATGLRTPSVNTLTTFSGTTPTTGNLLKVTNTNPEYAFSYDVGYRWHDDFFVASASAYLQDLKNYLASAQLDPGDFITSNIGNVKIYGIDLEAGTKPWNGFTFYGSAEIQNSHLNKNLASDYSGSTILYALTDGKQLVDTPNWILAADIGWAQDGFFADVRPQCRGQRYTTLNNDEAVPAYCTLNLSAGYHFGDGFGFKNATLQFYGVNVTDTNYFGQIYSTATTNSKVGQAFTQNGTPITGTNIGAESYTGEPGAPLFIGARFSVDVN